MATPRIAAVRRLAVLALLGFTLPRPAAAQVTVTTVAGNGNAGWQDGPAAQAEFDAPHGLCVDAQGNCYVADANNHLVRRISAIGQVTTIAGNGGCGYFDFPNGPLSEFCGPYAIALDLSGSAMVTDATNGSIRKIDATGAVTTWAGNGTAGYQDGSGAAARFYYPTGLIADGRGGLIVSDAENHRIRYVSPSALVSTLAGDGTRGFVNGPAASAQFRELQGIVRDVSGNIYVADRASHVIRRLTPAGIVDTYAGTGISGYRNGPAAQAQFASPFGLAIDAAGALYVAERDNHRIRRIDTAGNVTTLAGTGVAGYADGPVGQAQFNSPYGLCLAPNGRDLYVADAGNNRIRRLTLGPLSTATPNQLTWQVYPNPAATQCRFSGTASQGQEVDVKLLDMLGRTVMMTSSKVPITGEAGFLLEIGHLPAGVYNCQLTVDNVTQHQRLLIKR